MSKKIIFIPGWLDQGINFPQYETLEIWKENIKPDVKLDCDVIIAHSLGCHFALFDWENAKDKKIVFVNPLVSNRNVFSWFWRWVKFRMGETQSVQRKYIISPRRVARGVFYYFKFLMPDAFSRLDNMTDHNMIVIRGKKDLYFCDEESCVLLKEKKIEVIELDEVGHLWNSKIDEEIRRIIGE
ncbi:MAG: hypothetical protein WCV59_01470 [Parcubacteria group bacterium]|jgi:hypothetical protein